MTNNDRPQPAARADKLDVHILLDTLAQAARGNALDPETCETIVDIAREYNFTEFAAEDVQALYDCGATLRMQGELASALKWYAEKSHYEAKNVTFASHGDGSQSQHLQTAVEFDKGSRARKTLESVGLLGQPAQPLPEMPAESYAPGATPLPMELDADNVVPIGGIAYFHCSKEEFEATIDALISEVCNAAANWPAFNSAHEGYGIIAEEFRELEDHVFTNQKRRDLTAMKKEALQLAATALRLALDVCSEERGRR